MKRRISALLLSAAMMLSLMSSAMAAESTPTVTVSDAAALAGETVSVSISLANNPGIVALRLRIACDTGVMTLVGVEDRGRFQSVTYTDDGESMAKSPYVILWHSATAARPSIPRLRSVRPHAMMIRLNPFASFSKPHRSLQLT